MKKITTILLCFTLLISISSSVYADNSHCYTIKKANGNTVTINIEPDAMGKITKKEALHIANENPDASNITIQEVGFAPSTSRHEFSEQNFGPRFVLPIILLETSKTYTKKNVFWSDVFLDSCAKGETKKLSFTKTSVFNATVTGSVSSSSLGITSSLKYVMEKGRILEGPTAPGTNTREFRCK